jgi:hypothetical protein
MPSSPNATGSWSDHRLRQIKAAASFIAGILEDPYHALIDDRNCELFVNEVAQLQEWLTPCEQWSRDEKTRPPSISRAILDALFSLWSLFSRLRLPRGQKRSDHSRMGLDLLVFCPEPLRKQFQEAQQQPPPSPRPRWDKRTRKVWFGATLCKHYKRPAPNQEKILDAFAARDWPETPIPNPLRGEQGTEALKDLQNALRGSPLELCGDGTGKICWRPRS